MRTRLCVGMLCVLAVGCNESKNGTKVKSLPALETSIAVGSAALERSIAGGLAVFEKRYGGMWMDESFALAPFPGGGYVLAGNSQKLDRNRVAGGYIADYDAYVVKVDSSGKQQWSRRLAAGMDPKKGVSSLALMTKDAYDSAEDLVVLEDGTILVAGVKKTDAGTRPWAIKLDGKGTVVWDQTYGSETGKALSVARIKNDQFVLVGYSKKAGSSDLAIWVVNGEGKLQHTSTYGGKEVDKGFAVAPTEDGYVVAGYTGSKGAGKHDAWLLVFAGHKLVREHTFGGPEHDGAFDVLIQDDTTVLVGDKAGRGWVGWVNSQGQLVREKLLPEKPIPPREIVADLPTPEHLPTSFEPQHATGKFRSAVQSPHYLVLGGSIRERGLTAAWLVGLDTSGEVVVDRRFSFRRSVINGMVVTGEGGVALTGNWASPGSNYSNFWLCKTDDKLSGCD